MDRRRFIGRTGQALSGLLLSRPLCLSASGRVWPAGEAPAFVHPGVLHDRADLERVRAGVASGEEPWLSGWNALRQSRVALLDWTPKPFREVNRGPYNRPDIGSTELLSDAAAAYTHAIQWYVLRDELHARRAVEILDAYATTLQAVVGHDARLLVGMSGISLVAAAELMRHCYDGWAPEGQQRFELLLRRLFYPVIQDFYPSANGNWDAAMIQTMLAMGVFLEDRGMFQRAVHYYLDGPGNGAVRNYFNEFGESQESGRDQAHTQMGLGYLGCACEIAWKQGVDLYGAHGRRLARGFEYTARYNLGHEVPYEPYTSYQARYHYPAISERARGEFRPVYERVYHHYHHRLGMEMPYTRQVVERIRPEGLNLAHVGWGTLMHAGPGATGG